MPHHQLARTRDRLGNRPEIEDIRPAGFLLHDGVRHIILSAWACGTLGFAPRAIKAHSGERGRTGMAEAEQISVVDVAVVGGGPTGAIAALAAADAGLRTALVAPMPEHDPRTTALMMPAVQLLERLGVWSLVGAEAAPLAAIRIVDDTGHLPRAPEIAFDAGEIGLEAFGYNVPNNGLNAALATRLKAAGVERVEAMARKVVPGVPARIETAFETVVADLVVGADGFHSLVRAEMGFGTRRWSYEQSALVTMLAHTRPHNDTSVEFHTAGGPFTLVPLAGQRSSLVWVGRPDDTARRRGLADAALAREIERASHGVLGRITIDGPRGTFPLEGMVAKHFGEANVVLVGEAGHRFPPIGAQGLNLGLRDVATLAELFASAAAHGGLRALAPVYDRRRRLDIGTRTVGVDLLNRSLLTGFAPVGALRALGVAAARNVGPLRRAMMRAGVG
ncbi:MAG: UbiH/UbiF family hydroxylase [Acuticoccus sp.]